MKLLILSAFVAVLTFWAQPAHAQTAAVCQGDWYAAGYADAERNGSPENAVSRVDEEAQRCGVPGEQDRTDYEVGFELGLRDFCTPIRAFTMARAGRLYSGWCPSDLAAGFADGYRDGLRVQAVEATLSEANVAERHVREMRIDAMNAVDAARIDRALGPLARRGRPEGRAESDRRDYAFMQMTSDLGQVQRNLDTIQDVLPGVEAQLDDLREEIGDKYGEW